MSRISIRELERLKRSLERFSDLVDEHYPGYADVMGNRGDDATETIRNALTAGAYITGWIGYRRNHRSDPFEGKVR